jgi:pimeloyl-ACP methyl ester carboxylesterase
VIKGTSSFEDVLTDVIHTPVEFFDTYAHLGMSKAARFVQERTRLIISELLVPMGYKVVVTGHSLGAGIASLLAVLLREDMGITSLRCFAFAPPPTLDKPHAKRANQYIWAMVHNDDIIPRWNFGAVAAAIAMFESYIQQIDKTGLSVEEFYAQRSFQARMADLETLVEERQKKAHRDMVVIGRVVYFVKMPQHGYAWSEIPSDAKSLRRIEFSPTALSDHAMDLYREALDMSVKKFQQGNAKWMGCAQM